MTTTTTTSDVQAALDYAADHDLFTLDHDTPGARVHTVVHPGDHTVHTIDLEKFADRPRRPRGTITALTADGFVNAVSRRLLNGTDQTGWNIYADPDKFHLTAILNDDVDDLAGWRDYRVQLALRPTAEWKTWQENQGLKSQEDFATIIDDGVADIVEPAGALMLTMAETFHATVDTRFQQGANMQNGQRQLVFEEKINATAGQGGSIVIPDRFALGLRLFIGGPAYRVEAKLKYRLRDGNLTIGYTLDRPDDVVRAAFTDLATSVAGQLNHHPIEGEAPPARN